MKGVIAMVLSLSFFGLAQGHTTYLWAPCQIPAEAFSALPERAQTLSIPIARFLPEKGTLEFLGAADETELLSGNAFLYLDGDFFLLGIREGNWTTILRGKPDSAELIIFRTGAPEILSSFSILEALGLLPAGAAIELSEKNRALETSSCTYGRETRPHPLDLGGASRLVFLCPGLWPRAGRNPRARGGRASGKPFSSF